MRVALVLQEDPSSFEYYSQIKRIIRTHIIVNIFIMHIFIGIIVIVFMIRNIHISFLIYK